MIDNVYNNAIDNANENAIDNNVDNDCHDAIDNDDENDVDNKVDNDCNKNNSGIPYTISINLTQPQSKDPYAIYRFPKHDPEPSPASKVEISPFGKFVIHY